MSNLLADKFAKIGARLKVSDSVVPQRRRLVGEPTGGVRLDVKNDNEGEFFDISLFTQGGQKPNLTVLDVQPGDRHLLLLAKTVAGDKSKFLCGHDERHWFVAAIPESAPVGTVRQAKEALKPPEVQARQIGLKAKDRNRRKNDAYVRQGEWFFIPAPEIGEPDHALVLKKEPLTRGRGSKPHTLEFAYRKGGEQVFVCSRYPSGVNLKTYNQILKTEKDAKSYGWRTMTKDPTLYCKGRVTHADHKTINLVGWHRVVMNTESKAKAMQHVVFLD